MKFAIQSGYWDRGVEALCRNFPYRIAKFPAIEPDEIPLGSVEWVEILLGRHVKPDYHPTFLSHLLLRKTRMQDEWPLGHPCFIKPAYRHKEWKAKIYSGRGYKGKKKGPYLISEIVRFRNEYRYYVANGKILSGWWYWGDSQDDQQRHEGSEIPEAPILDTQFPETFCGAVDMGELWETGQLALIESNAPFSCGWYGEQDQSMDYCLFLQAGWKWLKEGRDCLSD